MAALVDSKTLIDYGMSLSSNFSLEHMTTGAFSNVLGKFIPTFPAKLLPWQPNGMFSSSLPLWQLVRNLQIGSMNVMENMIGSVGSDLIVMAGFLNSAPKTTDAIAELGHTIGNSVDIAVNNYLDNPYMIVKDIAKIASNATNINVIYGPGASWFHMDLQIGSDGIVVPTDGPKITSSNLITGETMDGSVPFFGYA